MICEKGHIMPETSLACPACVDLASTQALRELQLEFLRKVAAGAFGYTLRITKNPERHVILYSTDARTFCGLKLDPKPRIIYALYHDDTLKTMCAGCRIELKRLFDEITH